MTAETTCALDQASIRSANPKPLLDRVVRIATMSRQLLEELRTRPLDAAGLNRLRAIDTKIIAELLADLDPDLRQELQRLVQPLTCQAELTDANSASPTLTWSAGIQEVASHCAVIDYLRSGLAAGMAVPDAADPSLNIFRVCQQQ
jgi:hypothetical protein